MSSEADGEVMESGGLIELSSGSLRLVLAPAVGGSIARFDRIEGERRVPALRGADGAPASVLDTASFPLVPFCNRIRGGSFGFRGWEVSLASNMAGDPSPLHGQGWLAAWDVKHQGGDSAELVYRHRGGEWPWDYEARQSFRLSGDALDLALTCRNKSRGPMPCGLGQHPYFHCTPETRLRTGVREAWTIDEQVLPVAKVPASGRYDLSDRLVCGQDLDNGWGGWSGTAAIETPGEPFRIEMSSPDATFFQLYSPASGGIFVAEPVSHANAALNQPEEEWPELGMRILGPDEEMTLAMRIALVPAL
jgi:aldose 1-epimerase